MPWINQNNHTAFDHIKYTIVKSLVNFDKLVTVILIQIQGILLFCNQTKRDLNIKFEENINNNPLQEFILHTYILH